MCAIANSNRDLTRLQQKSLRVWIIPFLLSLFAFENIGCSSAKPPTGILSQAELDVRAASEARADELAPMDLQSAREKLEASKQAMAAKKYDDARRLAETAQVEAELAAAKAEAEITRRAADDLRRRLDPFRSENERATGLPSSPVSTKE